MRSLVFLLALVFSSLVAGQSSQEDEWSDESWEEEWSDEGWDSDQQETWTGFVELALGHRTRNDPLIDQSAILQEARLRLERDWQHDQFGFSFKGDLWRDQVLEEWDHHIREAALSFSLGEHTDIKLGRQVLTWGTGDLLFLNDLFPKGYTYYAGRSEDYLKVPSDAIRISYFGSALNVDLAVMPRFTPDEYFTGERFSFFGLQRANNQVQTLSAKEPSGVDNSEYALRIYKTLGSTELAFYAFHGFYKQPSQLADGLGFAPLFSLGGSLRRPLGKGVINSEFSWYFSRDDRQGTNPGLPNDQLRFLLGYEWEAVSNLTVGFQYYLEHTLDHQALLDNAPAPERAPREYRSLWSNRLTYRQDRDRLIWSLLSFYSPTDNDFYVRPSLTWRISDQWQWDIGANLFAGRQDHTPFGQLEDNSNIFSRLRYNY